MKRKKTLSIFTSAALAIGLLAGCSAEKTSETTKNGGESRGGQSLKLPHKVRFLVEQQR
ncbi:hypothetical protein LR68_02151 [Anoxybacillus sp. BCO1]|nr:hypothetical protein LR68_02151 [Anoxybacillus sp. BCO1]